jgi:hypothetical protein
MLSYFAKYKALFIFGLLAAYLAGAFQEPVLKALHAFSHLAKHLLIPPEGDVYFHAHEGHRHAHVGASPIPHRHPVINFLDDLLDNFSDSQPDQRQGKEQFKKKNPERLSAALELPYPVSFVEKRSFHLQKLFSSFTPAVPSPPPRCMLFSRIG